MSNSWVEMCMSRGVAHPPKILDNLLKSSDRKHNEQRGNGNGRRNDCHSRDGRNAGGEEKEEVGSLPELLKEEPTREKREKRE